MCWDVRAAWEASPMVPSEAWLRFGAIRSASANIATRDGDRRQPAPAIATMAACYRRPNGVPGATGTIVAMTLPEPTTTFHVEMIAVSDEPVTVEMVAVVQAALVAAASDADFVVMGEDRTEWTASMVVERIGRLPLAAQAAVGVMERAGRRVLPSWVPQSITVDYVTPEPEPV